jgi:copper(I)-binding protein
MRWAMAVSAAAIAAAIASPVLAAKVEITDAWFRALPANLPAGGYFKLHNSGTVEAVLTGADSPACGMLMLHQSMDMGGMEKMEMVASVSVPANGTIEFKPGGYHLMCTAPKPSLKAGARVPVTLEFKDGTKTVADFIVKTAAGQ